MVVTDKFDMVIVGAGFHGLSLARTYLEIHPNTNLLILDDQSTIGGVWSTSRLYPGLKTNSGAGSFEFTDYPMLGNPRYPEMKAWDHIPGDVVRRYLEDYAVKFGLHQRIRFRKRVVEAEDMGAEGWMLTVDSVDEEGWKEKRGGSEGQSARIHAAILVVATGMSTTPKIPSLLGSDRFASPIFHVRDFGKHAASTTPSPALPKDKPVNVVIISANKSAADAAHHYATNGMHVHWVIRPGGKGPCWFAPSTVSPFKFKAESLARTRAMTFLSPCIWGDADGFGWVRSLFHRTFLGQKIVDWFHLGLIQAGMEGSAGYGKNPNLQKLRPWRDMFWIGAGSASQNYTKPDVFELVRQGKIEVHIANVESLGEKEVRLGNGQVFRDVEALVCATGWTLNPTIKFFRDGVDIAAELGLPHAFGKMDEEEKALVARADAEILKAMPRLKAQPAPARPPYLQQTPYEVKDPAEETMEETFKLYRFMVPPSKIATRTLAFSGMTRDVSAPMIAEVQSLWLSAFFSHQIPSLEPSLPSSLVTSSPKSSSTAIEQADTVMHAKQARAQISARVKYESILHARYGLWRYPHGFGAVMPDIFYDFVPLFDLMISELGLRSWRKGSLMKEIFTGYMPRDYAGLVDEWVEMRKRGLSPSESAKVESRRVLLTVAMGVFPWVAMMFCTLVWVYRIKAMEL